MVKIHQGDIFSAPINVLIHQANCYCTFGSGIARVIKEEYPEAYERDCETTKGDLAKLGSYTLAKIPPPSQIELIINMYSQHGFSDGNRATSYDAMVKALTTVEGKFLNARALTPKSYVLGVPYKIGCGLGGGSWRIVEAIIRDIFEKSPIQLLICQREGDI